MSDAAMIPDLDIWRAADLLIRQHTADAELEVACLEDLMLDRGDDEGRLVACGSGGRSRRYSAAIEQAKLKRLSGLGDARNPRGSSARPRRRDPAPGAGPAGALEACGAAHDGASRGSTRMAGHAPIAAVA
jgi:hypothetical protein